MISMTESRTAIPLLVVALCFLTIGCGSDSGRSNESVIDMTWSGGRGYSTSYDRGGDRYRGLVQQVRKYDKDYYESHVNTQDASGNPIKPAQQVEFLDTGANVQTATITTAGVKSKAKSDKGIVFIDSEGNEVALDSFQGSPMILVFTRGFPGYICPMCTTYTAQITLEYQKFDDAGVKVLLVFPGQSTQVDDFVDACQEIAQSDEKIPFPVLLDPDLEAVKAFNIRADLSLPATYIFDGDGVMRWGFVGEKPHERPSVQVLLEQVQKL
ncbi:MAG: peroxiredoxin Q/BCP [Planctomycetota bacterium]|jgi:peroxiredoxin Q/BCP